MPSDPNRPDWGRYVVREWARGQVRKLGTPADDDLLGKCPTCGVFRRRQETAQAEVDEVCVHVCRVCGDVIDESPPF
ncbi:MAG TPA: hypothetical protein VGS80_16475 [Ktedonobacterales bacterium]|nr:hypothetical protein [Ktedonobacterales bacterium]